jgi:hypothetical protein
MQILGATPHDSPPPSREFRHGMPGRVGGRGKSLEKELATRSGKMR